jgi:hypothetical protein
MKGARIRAPFILRRDLDVEPEPRVENQIFRTSDIETACEVAHGGSPTRGSRSHVLMVSIL